MMTRLLVAPLLAAGLLLSTGCMSSRPDPADGPMADGRPAPPPPGRDGRPGPPPPGRDGRPAPPPPGGMDHAAMGHGPGVMVGGAMMLPTQTLVQNASGASNLTTLVAAVQAAGLVETLSGPGPFTVFAPPNSAFDALPAGTVATLTQPANRAQLTSILTYHVVPGRLMAGDLRDGQVLTTVNGQRLTVRKTGNTVTVGGATVTQADVAASNGVAHIIDRVLMPSM